MSYLFRSNDFTPKPSSQKSSSQDIQSDLIKISKSKMKKAEKVSSALNFLGSNVHLIKSEEDIALAKKIGTLINKKVKVESVNEFVGKLIQLPTKDRKMGMLFAKNVIFDKEKLYESILSLAKTKPSEIMRCLEHMELSEDQKFEVALICTKEGSEAITSYIKNLGLTNEAQRYELAKSVMSQYPFIAGKSLQDFNLNEDHLFEVVKMGVDSTGKGKFLSCFHDINFEKPEHRKEIFDTLNKQLLSIHNENVNELTRLRDVDSFKRIVSLNVEARPKEVNQPLLFSSTMTCGLENIFTMWEEKNFDKNKAIGYINNFIDQRCSHLDFTSVLQDIDKIKDPYAKQQSLVWFAASLFTMREQLTDDQFKWIQDKKLLAATAKFLPPALRYTLVLSLIDGMNNKSMVNLYKDENNKDGYPWEPLRPMLLACMRGSGVPETVIQAFNEKAQDSAFRDAKKFAMLINMLQLFNTNSDLDTNDKTELLRFLSLQGKDKFQSEIQNIITVIDSEETAMLKDIPQKTVAEVLEESITKQAKLDGVENPLEKYKETFGKSKQPLAFFTYAAKMKRLNNSAVMECWSLFATSVMKGTFKQERYKTENNPHLQKIKESHEKVFQDWQKESVHKVESDQVVPLKDSTFEWMHDKLIGNDHLDLTAFSFLKNYLAAPKEEREDIVKALSEEVKNRRLEKGEAINLLRLEASLIRYAEENNPAQIKANTETLLKLLKTNGYENSPFIEDINEYAAVQIANNKTSIDKKFIVVNSDNPFDLFYCGSIPGSCQDIKTGSPGDIQALLGYVMDGKNRVLMVKDPEGKVVARCLIRLLWDGEKPVLFMERFYPPPSIQKTDPLFEKALNQAAIDIAKNLGIPLLSVHGTGEAYENHIHSLGGSAPYDYTDAVKPGLRAKGIYTIKNAKYFRID